MSGSDVVDTNGITVQGFTNGITATAGSTIQGIYISYPNDYTADDLVSVSSDTSVAYIVICKDDVTDDRVVKAYVTSEKSGLAEMYIRTSDGKYESERFMINVINDPEKTDITEADTDMEFAVYITPSGTKYHLSKKCAGDKAVPVAFEKAIGDGYSPCKNCAMNKK